MSPLGFAWRSLTRQPARALLGVVGVAAVGALLFDMLMLSRGLVVSFTELLDATGFDVRVTSTSAAPFAGPRIRGAAATVEEIGRLPEVEAVVPLRLSRAEAEVSADEFVGLTFMGTGELTRNVWNVVEGVDLDQHGGGADALVVSRNLAERLGIVTGARVRLWGNCRPEWLSLPPAEFDVVGIAEFPFESPSERTAATHLRVFERVCGDSEPDRADLLLVASRDGVDTEVAAAAVERLRPDLEAFSNRQLMLRFQQRDFSYFRQISFVLSAVTLLFAFLLVTTLLTVSANQRLAEVAALRALGFTRLRIVADLVCESALLVGTGGLLAVPLGGLVATWLDGILKTMPTIPARIHFFVFEPRSLLLHAGLLALTGLLASVYPVWLAARLPIARTLRREVVS